MFTLLQTLPLRRILLEQTPAIAVSWLLAELFYKFHSFTLECAAFLVTWFVIDLVIQFISRLIQYRHHNSMSPHDAKGRETPG